MVDLLTFGDCQSVPCQAVVSSLLAAMANMECHHSTLQEVCGRIANVARGRCNGKETDANNLIAWVHAVDV